MSRIPNLILTYVWLIVILFTVFLLLGTSKVLSPDYTCELEKGLYCKNVVLGRDRVTMLIQNRMDRSAIITSMNIKEENLNCNLAKPIEVKRESEREISLGCIRQLDRFYDARIKATVNKEDVFGRMTVKT